MAEYRIVLNIETEMGDPNKWDWETLLITDPDVEKLISVTVKPRGLTCRHCGEEIYEVKDVYVDSTGGDVCCADKFTEKNENGQHELEDLSG